MSEGRFCVVRLLVLAKYAIFALQCNSNSMSRLSVTAIAFLFFPLCLFSQKHIERGYETIRSTDARVIVETLSHDSLQGRKAGEEGGRKAAEYIVSLLKEWGIEPLEANGFLQPFEVGGCEMNNILAVIPGRSDECVVIGAHYDHLGCDSTLVGDGCFNGADDNASGVSAVLQIARAVKKCGKKPQRNIIFAFWDGEEKGLLGSIHFVKKYPFLSDIMAYMNFDMVGRGPVDNPKHMTYFYTESCPAFGEWLKEDMAERKFCFVPNYRAWDRPVHGSDNAPFAKKEIPIVWYHTEGHPDYHQTSDTADKIDYDKLQDITRAAYLCTWRLANEKSYGEGL